MQDITERKHSEESLRRFVEQGGRLIGVGAGAGAIAPIFDLPVRSPGPSSPSSSEEFLRTRDARRRAEREDEISGVILPVQVDEAHPLAWGTGSSSFVLHEGTTVFDPAPAAETVAHFPENLTPIGAISDDNLRRLSGGAWLVSEARGRGSVTLFADDPLFRLFWHETHSLYVNSLLIGPRR